MDSVKVVPANDKSNETAPKKESKKKKKLNKCNKCRKKLGLLPIKCRCEKMYCNTCQYPEDHGCAFDFRAHAREKIEKENPIIKCNKVNPI